MSIIRVKRQDASAWLYLSQGGRLVQDKERAERFDLNEAGRRILEYLNDYPGWEFEEVPEEKGGA